MSEALTIAIVLCIICCIFVVVFNWYYGIFKQPLYIAVFALISSFIPIVMSLGLLPYDIALYFSDGDYNAKETLKTAFEILYWTSFALTWVVIPLGRDFFYYRYAVNLNRRILYVLKDNGMFYGIAVGIIVVIAGILLSTTSLTINDTMPIVMAISNVYGLVLLCLLLGHGLIAFPRDLWEKADPDFRYEYSIARLDRITQQCSDAVANGIALRDLATNLQNDLPTFLLSDFRTHYSHRLELLNKLTVELPIPDAYFISTPSRKKIKKLCTLKWRDASLRDVESLFFEMDRINSLIQENNHSLYSAAGEAKVAILERNRKEEGSTLFYASFFWRRMWAVLFGVFTAICLWGEIAMMFNPELSLFNYLMRLSLSPSTKMILVSFPALMYLHWIGSWSLTHFRLGTLFHFVPHATNSFSLHYWAILLCRLGPTIGYHYIKQIEASETAFIEVMKILDKIPIIGADLNRYSPIFLFIVLIFVGAKIWDNILNSVGVQRFTFDDLYSKAALASRGQEVLATIHPEIASLQDADSHYFVNGLLNEIQRI